MMAKKSGAKKSKKARIHITGMTCTTCAATIEKGLAETAGVEQANVSFASEKASIEYDPSKVGLAKIKSAVSQLGYGMATRKSIFPVGGMTCASCVARVEQALSSVPGVVSANVNLASEKATVEYIEGTEIADLRWAVKEAGYELGSEAETLEDVATAARREIRALRNRLILAVVLAASIMALGFGPAPAHRCRCACRRKGQGLQAAGADDVLDRRLHGHSRLRGAPQGRQECGQCRGRDRRGPPG